MLTTPAAATGTIVALLILIAAVSAGRLAAGCLTRRRTGRDADALHVLMGVAMAGMLAPALAWGPPQAWLAVFTASAAWFAARTFSARGPSAGSCAQPALLAVESAAMAYMLLPASASTAGPSRPMAMPGAYAGPNPALTVVLALAMLGYLLWTTDRLAARRTSADGKLAASVQISMSIAMGYMLITML